MTVSKRRNLMNAFFRSYLSYCPIAWMCHSRNLNNKISKLHERCLRIAYNDKLSSFQNLLDQDRSVSLHTRNLQTLAIEMYKVSRGIAPKIFADIFSCNSRLNCDLRYQSDFNRPLIKSYLMEQKPFHIWVRGSGLVPLEMKRKINSFSVQNSYKLFQVLKRKCSFKAYLFYRFLGFLKTTNLYVRVDG